MIPQSCDVLIVGAGPVGMTAAITLAQAGLAPVIIDRAEVQQTTSRAAVIHAHTLEVLDPLGVSGRMLSEGKQIGKFAFRDRDRLLGLIRFDGLPTEHQTLLMLTQDRTEAIFLDRLAELSVPVLRGVTFFGYRETEAGVLATLATSEGFVTVAAKYLIGADGMHSAVRAACQIPFDGEQFEGSFALADVVLDGAGERDEVTLFFSPEGLVVVAPLPGGRYRIVATADAAPERPDAQFVQRLLDDRGPTRPSLGRVRDVAWSSRFRLHHRLARQYRKGPVFLAGDAAHAHSPAGGQGMNTGIVDAVVIGRLLSEVLLGRAGEVTLNRYEILRRPAAAKVLSLTGRMTKAATLRGTWQRRLRNLLLSVLARLPWFRKGLALNLSGIARRSAVPTDLLQG
jgi:2-polyprenyl-6-methoxyphenol hydroxylase-like FAD-dependent oxidoreductase